MKMIKKPINSRDAGERGPEGRARVCDCSQKTIGGVRNCDLLEETILCTLPETSEEFCEAMDLL